MTIPLIQLAPSGNANMRKIQKPCRDANLLSHPETSCHKSGSSRFDNEKRAKGRVPARSRPRPGGPIRKITRQITRLANVIAGGQKQSPEGVTSTGETA